jgi:hypothetical protein
VTSQRVDTASGEILPAGEGEQLRQLARRFPDGFIERKDGIDYVAHHVVNQRLLSIVGPFDFKLVEVVRGDVAAIAPNSEGRSRRARQGTPALHSVVVGGVWRLSCTVDGQRVEVEEVGDVGDVHNWPHDGARLKDAASDALKRCCMRLGLGLHLWAQEHYFLDTQLRRDEDGQPDQDAEAEQAVPAQQTPDTAAKAAQQPARSEPGNAEVVSAEPMIDQGMPTPEAIAWLGQLPSPDSRSLAEARAIAEACSLAFQRALGNAKLQRFGRDHHLYNDPDMQHWTTCMHDAREQLLQRGVVA